MNKRERSACDANLVMIRHSIGKYGKLDEITVGYMARSFSALARSSLRSKNEIITEAACVPAIVNHPDFVI